MPQYVSSLDWVWAHQIRRQAVKFSDRNRNGHSRRESPVRVSSPGPPIDSGGSGRLNHASKARDPQQFPMISTKASQHLENYQCACSSKNRTEKEFALHQRDTTAEGGKRREREQFPQTWVRPRRFHLGGARTTRHVIPLSVDCQTFAF